MKKIPLPNKLIRFQWLTGCESETMNQLDPQYNITLTRLSFTFEINANNDYHIINTQQSHTIQFISPPNGTVILKNLHT